MNVMYLIIIAAFVIVIVCLEMRERKNRKNIPSGEEFVDIAHFSYEEKLRKYTSDYDVISPIMRTRF